MNFNIIWLVVRTELVAFFLNWPPCIEDLLNTALK